MTSFQQLTTYIFTWQTRMFCSVNPHKPHLRHPESVAFHAWCCRCIAQLYVGIPSRWGRGHCWTNGKWHYINKMYFPKERKNQNCKHTKITALKDHVSIVPLIPSSRCFGCWNSHQNSCRNVESHLGLRRGCIITHQQQNSQMLPIHFRDRA